MPINPPSGSSGGSNGAPMGERQRRAAELRAQMEAQAQQAGVTVDESDEQGTGPVGQGDWIVREGDCISSIARTTGHFWETIWNDPANAELREVRGNPNVLLVGDRVTVPELRPKEESGAAEQRHRFKRKGEPSKLVLKFEKDGLPRANEPYVLKVDGQETTGTTDPEGKLEVPISGNARWADLTIGEGERKTEYRLLLGSIDPVTEISGIQARLTNLGYSCESNGKLGPYTVQALRLFQKDNALPETGKPDELTRAKLVEVHGC